MLRRGPLWPLARSLRPSAGSMMVSTSMWMPGPTLMTVRCWRVSSQELQQRGIYQYSFLYVYALLNWKKMEDQSGSDPLWLSDQSQIRVSSISHSNNWHGKCPCNILNCQGDSQGAILQLSRRLWELSPPRKPVLQSLLEERGEILRHSLVTVLRHRLIQGTKEKYIGHRRCYYY